MRILIAEDDPVSRRVLESTLKKWGHEVVSCADGKQALEVVEGSDCPRLAILDWMMPQLDGVNLCKKIRQLDRDAYIYVIMLTARGQTEDIVEAMEIGADDYMVKPFNPHELKVRVRAGQRIVGLQSELIEAREALRIQATRDGLTGISNRRAILDTLDKELYRADRHSQPISVIMCDLDHFKRINDQLGHQAGDEVLRESTRRLGTCVRQYDTVGRYGGEEFLIVLPSCVSDEAVAVAGRMRQAIAEKSILPDQELWLTASFGAAGTDVGIVREAEVLIRAADVALYRAKERGRNRVEAAGVEDASPPSGS